MSKKFWIKFGIITGSVIGAIYALFLILPFIISPLVNHYSDNISEEIKKVSGLTSELEGFRLVTTPKLTVGVKVGKFALITPEKKEIMRADDFAVKMSLLPLLARKIEVDLVSLKNLDVNLGVNKDGSFEIEKYIPDTEEPKKSEETDTEPSYLPLGLKLSNRLPDIKIDSYNVCFTDTSTKKDYCIKGNKTEIKDFVLNKGLKVAADGSVTLAGREQFKYKVKVHNKIMPDVELNELVFNPQTEEEQKKEEFKINILDIFKGLYANNITANVNGDMTFAPDGNSGFLQVNNLGVSPSGIKLPPSDMNLKLKGHKTDIQAHLYTAQNEASTVTGFIKTGKNTNIDMTFKSNADLANVVKIVNAAALTFNIKDLKTLSANGKIDADFNIKSDLKKVNSNGYLKIPFAGVNYGLYGVKIDNINADIVLNNNNINIKNLGFMILGQPLKLYGTLSETAVADLHLVANNLGLKGLLIACGQAALLKENPVASGLVSMKADIVGKLDSIRPTAKIILSQVDVKNIPADLRFVVPNVDIDIISDGKTFSGDAIGTGIKIINPALTVSVPRIMADIKENTIEISKTPVTAEKINLNVSGKINNYLTEKITLDFVTTGDIKSTLKGDMNMVKQTLNLAFSAPEICTIVIPMFDKSKMKFKGGVNITGSMTDPHLSGSFDVPSISIPEVVVDMENMTAKLNGPILKGNATVGKFVSGGIIAEDITTDFLMKGSDFYLNNLKGSAFKGKFNGDIIYNMANAKTNVVFSGSGMDAERAIAGAAGISGALSGTLEFDTKMNLIVYPEYDRMMKSIKGNLAFKINKGAFGKIGRLEHFFMAPNIIKNTILKNTVSTVSNLAGIKSSAEFSYISGNMTLSDGWANIDNIKSTGVSIAYFIRGKYNLLNGTTNVTILGRMNNKVVKLLGPLGELSAEKILSYIPKLGDLTKVLAKDMTEDPDKERTVEIPALTETASGHKDFKVIYNGGLESTSSVKSFKWLTKSDTSELEQKSLSETLKSIKPSVNTDIKDTVTGVKDMINTVKTTKETMKTDAKNDLNELKNSVNDIKNLFKSVKTTPSAAETTQSVQTTTPVQTVPVQTAEPVQTVPATAETSAE